MAEITVTETDRRRTTATILDVREDVEVTDGMIPGALHIPMGQLQTRLSELDPPFPSSSSATAATAVSPSPRPSPVQATQRTPWPAACPSGPAPDSPPFDHPSLVEENTTPTA